jgi:hypothetical protein
VLGRRVDLMDALRMVAAARLGGGRGVLTGVVVSASAELAFR